MPLCWPTYILRHFLDILQPTCGCLELKDAESAKCKKSSDLQPRGAKTKRRPAIWPDPDPDFASPATHWLAGGCLAHTHTRLRAQAGWSSWIFVVFLGLFHLTSLVILIDSHWTNLQTGSKGLKGLTTSSLHLPDRDLKIVASKKRKSLSADLLSQRIIAFQR